MPLTIEQVNAQAAEIDARMQLPSSDPNHLSFSDGRIALFNLADQLDVSIPPGASAVFYSGPFRDVGGGSTSVHSGAIAAEIVDRANTGNPPATRLITLDQTALGQVLSADNSSFLVALQRATQTPAEFTRALQGSANGDGVSDSLFGRGSARFAAAATGPSFGLTGHASDLRVWRQVEVAALLNNPDGGTINGISRQDLVALRTSRDMQAVVDLLNAVSGVSSLRGVSFQAPDGQNVTPVRVKADFFPEMGISGIPDIHGAPGGHTSSTIRMRENATALVGWLDTIDAAPPELREQLLARGGLRSSYHRANQILEIRANQNIDLTGASTVATVFVVSAFAAVLFSTRDAIAVRRQMI